MRLFHWFIIRHLAGQPLRSAATVTGIALGVAVVTAIRLANASSVAGFEAALDAMSGRTSLEVLGSGLGIDETRLPDLAWLRGYGVMSPVIEGDVSLAADSQAADGRQPAPSQLSSRAASLRILGIDVLRDEPLRDFALVAGRQQARAGNDGAPDGAAGPHGNVRARDAEMLEVLLDPESLVLTEKFADAHDLRIGQEILLAINDCTRAFRIRGLLADAGPARALDGNIAVMDIAAAQWALGRLGRIDRLDLRLSDPSAIDSTERMIAERLPAGFSVQRPDRRGKQVENLLGAFHANLTALSYVALLVGLFLVYNTISTAVVVRRREIGTLRALGVSRTRIRSMFLCEAALLAVPGCAVGIVAGRVLADAAVNLTRTTVRVLYIASAASPVALTTSDVAWALAVGLPLSIFAAFLPAHEASRVAPMAAIRGADRLESRFRLRWRRVVLPVVLLAIAVVLATRDAVRGLPLYAYGSALALVLGAAFLVPVVLFVLGRLSERFLRGTGRVEIWLARTNLAGAVPRLSVSVAALSVALSMMVAVAIMVGSFRDTVIYWVGQTVRADLIVGAATRAGGSRQATLSGEIAATVARHPAVAAVDAIRSTSIPYEDGQIYLTAGDVDVLLTHGNLLFKEPAGARSAVASSVGRDVVMVSEPFSLKYRKRSGDSISLATLHGSATFRISAVYFDYTTDRGQVLMDRRTFARHFGSLDPMTLNVYLRPEADPETVRSQLFESLPAGARIFIYTNRTLRGEILRIFDSTFAITYALEIIAIVVAILGVAATLITLILERRRELAILRLVGADSGQVRRMVILEAACIGGVSQAIGLGIGLLLSLVLIFVVNVQSFGWTIQFRLPVLFLLQMSFLILVATAIAGLLPARLASRFSMASEVVEE